MGQTYVVNANLKFKNNDPRDFCSIIMKKATDERILTLQRHYYNLEDPFECFKMLTTDEARNKGDGIYSADFEASYSWEPVLLNYFAEVFSSGAVDDGSVVDIYPDGVRHRFEMKNGKMIESRTYSQK